MPVALIEQPTPLLVLAVVLVAGVVSGTIARRFHLPGVTGQILAGVVLGPVLHVFRHEVVAGLAPITNFALGLMAVSVGSHLHLARLSNAARRLTILLACEALITPAIVFGAVTVLGGAPPTIGLLIATIAISTAPATTLAIIRETRSKGVFVKTLVAAVALNNIACVLLFAMAHSASLAALASDSVSGFQVLIAPLREVGFAVFLGGGMGGALVLATRHVVRTDRLATFSLLAILLTVSLADQLESSPLLACLFLGATLANLSPDKEEIGHEVFDNFETAIFAVFFTLAGMELRFVSLGEVGVLAILAFGGRAAGKLIAGRLAMAAAGATERVRRNLGAALLPQAGLAVGLMLLVTEDQRFPENIRSSILALVLAVVTLSELVGPLMTRRALQHSGDLGKDRPRLIDFIHEEHIVTDFEATDIEDAIRQLTDVLVRTQKTGGADQASMLASALERERSGSTCMGSGLAIPHATLREGESIIGAIGISARGLPLETPDGQPVHCMVLLATPESQRNHHLEVMAALATAILGDRSIGHQLYRAKSPAHAYELLHHEEAEDFNHFLED